RGLVTDQAARGDSGRPFGVTRTSVRYCTLRAERPRGSAMLQATHRHEHADEATVYSEAKQAGFFFAGVRCRTNVRVTPTRRVGRRFRTRKLLNGEARYRIQLTAMPKTRRAKKSAKKRSFVHRDGRSSPSASGP